MTWTACRDRSSGHEKLLAWIDKNENSLFLSDNKTEKIPDETYISILEKVSNANSTLQNSDTLIIGKQDAMTLLQKTVDFNAYLDGLSARKGVDTRPITRTAAKGIYHNYIDARALASKISTNPNAIKNDTTKAVLFTLPHIIKAFKDVYNPNIFTWGDTSWWNDKGLIIYPANYGSAGDLQGNNTWQSTFVVQLARDTVDIVSGKDSWRVESEKLFNYGDLEPPKLHIVNPADTPK